MSRRRRSLFSELCEGFDALKQEREGKIPLRKHPIQAKPAPQVTARKLIALRERMNLSRAVFVRHLRTNERTLENREQGRSKPNAQAALMIKLVERFPETLRSLAAIQFAVMLSASKMRCLLNHRD
jgi:putative transcriptional regulator